MNTTTVVETQAVQAVEQTQAVIDKAQVAAQEAAGTSPAAQDAPAAELRFIALSRLRLSRRDVRKTTAPVDALAESIARVGLLQNLIVVPVPGQDDLYEVVAGGRRWAALRLLAKHKRIARDQSIPCLVVPDDSAVTVSLTENVQRQDMHPADQFEAFLALVNEGRPVEDIAADFGVTPLVVQRRLRLARVSPRLLADYRQGGVTLEQLMALTLTDDHAAQEAAFYDAPAYEREPYALRRRLTQRDVDAARSPLARFVGVDAYTVAGGGIRRDLFAQDEGVYLTDADLLARLATGKLAVMAAGVRAEGWKWVEAAPVFGYAELAGFRRAPQVQREPTARQAKQIARLRARQAEIEEALHAAEEAEDEDAAAPLYEEGERVCEALDTLYTGLLAYAPETLAVAGAVVTLDREGAVVVHRGLMRPEDMKNAAQPEDGAPAGTDGDRANNPDAQSQATPAKTLSDRLVRNLSAYRTAALQAEVAGKPDVALAALVHRLALDVFYGGGDSLLQIHVHPQDGLRQHAPELAESKATAEFDALRTAWRERLPVDDAELFDALRQMKRADLLALLAVCVAGTVDAVTRDEHDTRADALARAVKLDMSAYWQPTAEAYFNHVPKAHILAAFKAFKPGEISRVAGYQKAVMAAEAGQHATAAKWLPAMLCAA